MSLGRKLKFTCLGVGGAGTNMCVTLEKENLENLNVVAVNSDTQQMEKIDVKTKILIGEKITNGFGCGGDPNVGKQCILNDINLLEPYISGSDIVFITCGMGGGTGTGASSEIAKFAKEKGALVISIVTTPFKFEGETRMRKASEGISELTDASDNIIIISNDNIMFVNPNKSISESFRASDDVLVDSIKTIINVLSNTGDLNLDFADIKNCMKNKKLAMISKASEKGSNKILEAAKKCCYNPLLEYSIKNARTLILNLKGSSDITLKDVDKCVEYFQNQSNTKLDVLFGYAIDKSMEDEVDLYLIATNYLTIDDLTQNVDMSRVNSNSDYHTMVNEQSLEDDESFDIIPNFLKMIKQKENN